MATQWDETIQEAQSGELGERRGATPEVRAQRSESRAAQTFTFFLRDLENKGLERKLAEQAIESVLCVMEQRLMVDEARHLEAQLPRKVVALLERCPRHKDRPYQKLNRQQLLSMVAEDLGVSVEEAERITRTVLSTVREHISQGEIDDVLGQLPHELHTLWEPIGMPAASGMSATPARMEGKKQMRNMPISEVMTRDVEVVSPDDTLQDAAELMRTLNVGPIPVCDGEKLVGIITDRDIVVRAVAQGMDPTDTRVSQAMTDQVECVFADEDIEVAVWKMREEQIRRILVVDHDNKLVGIVSLGDIATALGEQEAGETLEAISEPSQPMAH
jgi:CBS domain-containing protein/uncharacterized protein (DUF2267 family)